MYICYCNELEGLCLTQNVQSFSRAADDRFIKKGKLEATLKV